MGYLNMEFADGHIETIVNGERVAPAASVFHDPRTVDYKPSAEAARDIGMGDGSFPPAVPQQVV